MSRLSPLASLPFAGSRSPRMLVNALPLSMRGRRLMTFGAMTMPGLLATAWAWFVLGDWARLTTDSLLYLGAARCLAETGALPATRLVAPPGFVGLLSLLMHGGDLPLIAIRIVLSACWALASMLTFVLFRRHVGIAGATVAAVLTALSPVLLTQTTVVLTEPVFLVFSLAALTVLEHRAKEPLRAGLSCAAAGILAGTACIVRTIGFVLIPVGALWLLRAGDLPLRRRVIHAGIYLVIASAPQIAWSVRQSAFPSGPSYWQSIEKPRSWEHTSATGWRLQLERPGRLAPIRMDDVKSVLVPQVLGWRLFQAPLRAPASWICGIAILAATVWFGIRTRSPAALYVIATICVLLLWPWREGDRFVAPLVPLFMGVVVWVGQWILTKFPPRPARWMGPAIAATVLALWAAELVVEQRAIVRELDKSLQRLALAERLAIWQREHLPDHVNWAAVLPKRDDFKSVLMTSAYLSRRPANAVEVGPDNHQLPKCRTATAIADESLSRQVMRDWGMTPIDRIDQFVILQRTGPARSP